jgi:hypothetical protein
MTIIRAMQRTRGEYSIQYYFLERYFSILSGSEGEGCLGVGSSSSSSGSSSSGGGSGDYLHTSSGRKRWRLSRHQ